MDSLTQIVLGAACGEAVAGRKMGNRAMIWGAIGGTIPDLDVLARIFTDEITATSFHRGFMHSFLFAVLAPWALAEWTQWLYRKRPPNEQASYLMWVQLFFWSIFTHPILDCFTNWGTQIWQPFSNARVEWTSVSVVDPLYTLPFAALLIAAACLNRTSRWRRWLNWAGIIWGCLYLGYTYWHKTTVNTAFEQALQTRNLTAQRYTTGPSIFNNIVWYGVAESDTAFYFGLYGFNDCTPGFDKIATLPKRHDLLKNIPADDRAHQFLRWFSNGYYNVQAIRGDTFQVNDLRFGLLGDTLRGNNYVFPFQLFKDEHGNWDVREGTRDRSPEEMSAAASSLWARVKGQCRER